METLILLVAVLAAATAFGAWRRRTDGRMRVTAGGSPPAPAGTPAVDGAAGAGAAPPDVPGPLPADDVSEPLVGVPAGQAGTAGTPHGLSVDDLGAPLGERATLVQFSSAFCQPCRATRVVLGDVAEMVPGVAHVEIDAESHLELVRRLDVTRTPTVLVLDGAGRIRRRATGAPRRADVIAALGEIA